MCRYSGALFRRGFADSPFLPIDLTSAQFTPVGQPPRQIAGLRMAQAGGSELFSSAEIAFLAKEELIMIMPKIRMAELKFVHVCNTMIPLTPAPALTLPLLTQGTVDEMRPPKPISVPLWLALFFKKRDKCRLQPPVQLAEDPAGEGLAPHDGLADGSRLEQLRMALASVILAPQKLLVVCPSSRGIGAPGEDWPVAAQVSRHRRVGRRPQAHRHT